MLLQPYLQTKQAYQDTCEKNCPFNLTLRNGSHELLALTLVCSRIDYCREGRAIYAQLQYMLSAVAKRFDSPKFYHASHYRHCMPHWLLVSQCI